MAAQQETRQQEPGQETGQQEIPQQGTPLCLTPIGRVVRDAGTTGVRIDPPYRAGLRELGGFSHVLVLWWAGRYDDEDHRRTVVVPLPYAEDREAGVFACRSPARPNPVMTTVCAVESVDEETGVDQLGQVLAHRVVVEPAVLGQLRHAHRLGRFADESEDPVPRRVSQRSRLDLERIVRRHLGALLPATSGANGCCAAG